MNVPITSADFTHAVGRPPTLDDLDRCNCPDAGERGHLLCGWDYKLMLPYFLVPAEPVDTDRLLALQKALHIKLKVYQQHISVNFAPLFGLTREQVLQYGNPEILSGIWDHAYACAVLDIFQWLDKRPEPFESRMP